MSVHPTRRGTGLRKAGSGARALIARVAAGAFLAGAAVASDALPAGSSMLAASGSGLATPVSPESRAGQLLASGVFSLTAARSFRSRGFHAVVRVTGRLPIAVPSSAGKRLILLLSDAGRPAQRCTSEHPLSGCATLDWSDSVRRPHVPPGGVFDNRLTVRLAGGERDFHLRESGELAGTPARFEPG